MSRELDAECARALGWSGVEPDCYVHDGKDWCGTDPSGRGGYYDTGRKIVPHFSTDHTVARLLEDEIERRCLETKYSDALYEITYGVVSNDAANDGFDLWIVIRATPEQKARAFLEAVKP